MLKDDDQMHKEFDNIIELLKEKGFKLTPQRRCVLNTILSSNGKHLSAEEIYDLVKEFCPEIGLATVYRTMQVLDELGLVYKHNFDDGRIRYEITQNEDHQHHHLVCKKCGKVIEVEEDLLELLETQVENKYSFSITDHNVKFFGYCNLCK
jgi:Fur family transcriptional regulator, ferric uptake regulator